MFRALSGLILVAASTTFAAEPPIPARERTKMLTEFTEHVATLSKAIENSPREVALYSRRGDRHLFLGQFAKAVADFEKMIALDPAQQHEAMLLCAAHCGNELAAALGDIQRVVWRNTTAIAPRRVRCLNTRVLGQARYTKRDVTHVSFKT
jgi:tetratricopeptide (TPR) repeat protein